jgi:hypothetical protein
MRKGRFLQAAIWRCLGGLLLQLISAKIFIFAAGPTGSGVGANFLMNTGGQEKRPLGTLPLKHREDRGMGG